MTQPPDQTQPVNPVPPDLPPPPSSPPPTAPPPTAPPPTAPPPTAPPPTAPPPPRTDPTGPTAPLPPAPPPREKKPMDRGLLVRAALGLLVVGLTVAALAVEENQQQGYDAWTTWAVFATVMAAVHLLPLVWKPEPRRVWDVVALATVGLGFYWVALVLPMIGNATSFAQTLAVACALAHMWVLPGRR